MGDHGQPGGERLEQAGDDDVDGGGGLLGAGVGFINNLSEIKCHSGLQEKKRKDTINNNIYCKILKYNIETDD